MLAPANVIRLFVHIFALLYATKSRAGEKDDIFLKKNMKKKFGCFPDKLYYCRLAHKRKTYVLAQNSAYKR